MRVAGLRVEGVRAGLGIVLVQESMSSGFEGFKAPKGPRSYIAYTWALK